jgi:hypothetical protein
MAIGLKIPYLFTKYVKRLTDELGRHSPFLRIGFSRITVGGRADARR